MTRFAQELSGALGDFWKKDAQKKIKDMEDRIWNNEVIFGEDGVVKWNSNKRVMPKHCREVLSYTCYRDLFNEEASAAAEEEETNAFFQSYRESRKNHKVSAEERAEMMAAFGKGATVVDAITGQVVRL